MNAARAIEALHHLLTLSGVRPEARYYAKLAISHLVEEAKPDATVTCPRCGKDTTPRPGAVLRCTREDCPYWRVAV